MSRSRRARRHVPVLVVAVVAVCTAALVRLSTFPSARAAATILALAVVPKRLVTVPPHPEQFLTLATALVLHAGWVHLLGNMAYLVIFGPAVEQRLGHVRFAGLYLGSGIGGMALHVATHPSSATPVVGASAAIAGVLGASLILMPRRHITVSVPWLFRLEIGAVPSLLLIAGWFVMQFASALGAMAPQAESIAWFTHVGGFVTGAALAWPARSRGGKRAR